MPVFRMVLFSYQIFKLGYEQSGIDGVSSIFFHYEKSTEKLLLKATLFACPE